MLDGRFGVVARRRLKVVLMRREVEGSRDACSRLNRD